MWSSKWNLIIANQWELRCETTCENAGKNMCERVNFVSHHFHTRFTMHHFTLMWNMGVKCMWKVVKNMWNTCENNTFSHVFSHDIFNTCILLAVIVLSYLRTHRIEVLISWLQLCWSKVRELKVDTSLYERLRNISFGHEISPHTSWRPTFGGIARDMLCLSQHFCNGRNSST